MPAGRRRYLVIGWRTRGIHHEPLMESFDRVRSKCDWHRKVLTRGASLGRTSLPTTTACGRFFGPCGWPLPSTRRPILSRTRFSSCRLHWQERFECHHGRRIVWLVSDLGDYLLVLHDSGGIDHEDGSSEDERLFYDDAEGPAKALVEIVAQAHEVLEPLGLLAPVQREREIRADEHGGHVFVNRPQELLELTGLDLADGRVDRGDHAQQERLAARKQVIPAVRATVLALVEVPETKVGR